MANPETRKIAELKLHESSARIYDDAADTALIESIKENGIMEPLVITKGNIIVSGHRRFDASRKCGRTELPVVIFESEDSLNIRSAIIESNINRVKTNEQIGREAKELMAIESERAKQRQVRKSADSVPANLPGQMGDARDKVGKILNVSGKTVNKAIQLIEIIDSLSSEKKSTVVTELRRNLNKSFDRAFNYAKKEGLLDTQEEKEIGDYITLVDWEKLSNDEKKTALIPNKNKVFNPTTESIEWARWSWNPISGCLHGCEFCYARDRANLHYTKIKGDKFQPVFYPDRLTAPYKTKVPKKKYDSPVDAIGNKTVFTCSMADLFGDWVPDEWIDAVLNVIRDNPQWNYVLLTKNPERYVGIKFPDNAWAGVTVEKQSRVKRAENAFSKVNVKVKFLSCEPMMERLTFSDLGVFDWVIIGGASKSTMTEEFKPPREWINHLESQAKKAGCAVYEKTNLLERIREYPEFIEGRKL